MSGSSAAFESPVFQVSAPTEMAQAAASDPLVSAWVSANAGSGKTTVLVRRVLRLMLAGVNPSRIVCLTYTKAAAANMKIRLFDELRIWVSLSDEALAATLVTLSGSALPDSAPPPPPSRQALARARTLFATALETPGGLKIDTIHGFCTRLLQAAPFEANVPAHFDILQDSAALHLTQDAVRDVLALAAGAPGSALGQAMRRVAQDTEETRFDDLVKQVISGRALMCDADGMLLPLEQLEVRIARALDVDTDEDEAALAAGFMAAHASDWQSLTGWLAMLGKALAASSPKDVEQSRRIMAAVKAAAPLEAFEALYDVFITGAGTARGSLFTAPFAKANPASVAALADMAIPYQAAHERRRSIAAMQRSLALARVAHAILARMEEIKSRQRLLDFEDIILRTRSLLTRVEASWVLYRLDAGIDHVLVDEAQDTSAAQWDIIKAITADFFSGAGASHGARLRTIFAVGDEKQSIFSFQKAEPAAFDAMRSHFSGAITPLAKLGHRFRNIKLDQSFRSTSEVMEGVDLIFKPSAHHKGLVFEARMGPPAHSTARLGGIGSIDLWPLEANDPAMERRAFDAPVDAMSSAGTKLAIRIAKVLKRWTMDGFDDLGRPFRPGDVLIVMRSRSPLFQAIVRELKQAGVPAAGVDRLDVASHVAVEDMIVLADAALLPEDDLTLATALKGPVHGLDDRHLMQIAPGRPGSLRAAVASAASHDPRMQALDGRLGELEQRARSHGPFGFFARLLGPEGGRKAMLARLGDEAGDALDAFLAMALDHERRFGPSLGLFLGEMKSSAQQIKRDLAEAKGEVRVMTVHGAKGLEAPVVIIPDLGEPVRNAGRTTLLECSAPEANRQVLAPLWVPRKTMHARVTEQAKAAADASQDDERRRLFYVALTRARDRIILCGANAAGEAKPGTWYEMALSGLGERLQSSPAPDRRGEVLRFQLEPGQPQAGGLLKKPGLDMAASWPDWVDRPVPPRAERQAPLAPSRLRTGMEQEGAPNLARTAAVPDAARLLAGQLAHRLLQHLPQVPAHDRARVAGALAALHGAGLDRSVQQQVAASAVHLLARTDLQALFGLESFAEVSVSGEITLPDGRAVAVAGRVDRLAVDGGTVWIADYKSGPGPALPADVRPSTLSQIAAYHALVQAVYPGHDVRSLVVYLGNGVVIEPGPALRDAALGPG